MSSCSEAPKYRPRPPSPPCKTTGCLVWSRHLARSLIAWLDTKSAFAPDAAPKPIRLVATTILSTIPLSIAPSSLYLFLCVWDLFGMVCCRFSPKDTHVEDQRRRVRRARHTEGKRAAPCLFFVSVACIPQSASVLVDQPGLPCFLRRPSRAKASREQPAGIQARKWRRFPGTVFGWADGPLPWFRGMDSRLVKKLPDLFWVEPSFWVSSRHRNATRPAP